MAQRLRIATRNSPLALQQTQIFIKKLKHQWPQLEVQVLPFKTQGDELLNQKLQNFGGKGLFVKELEHALLQQQADIAVHSIKDLPAQLPAHLNLACITARDNPYDALLAQQTYQLHTLPPHATVGTASLRRQAQILAARPDLQVKTLRGNIQTRIAKLQQGEYDAIVLACAGLERMNLQHLIQEQLPVNLMLPACGQGAIGIECRQDDTDTLALLSPLHDPNTAICINIERQVNALLGGHCHVPIAIFAEFSSEHQICLQAKVFNPQGSQVLAFKAYSELTQLDKLAQHCAQSLIAQGALKLIYS